MNRYKKPRRERQNDLSLSWDKQKNDKALGTTESGPIKSLTLCNNNILSQGSPSNADDTMSRAHEQSIGINT
jgi:hypothetical protein